METISERIKELEENIWNMSKPAEEWNKSYMVVPALDVITLIKKYFIDVKYANKEFIDELKKRMINEDAKYGSYSLGEFGVELSLDIINKLCKEKGD